jgi:hypothetical protein
MQLLHGYEMRARGGTVELKYRIIEIRYAIEGTVNSVRNDDEVDQQIGRSLEQG